MGHPTTYLAPLLLLTPLLAGGAGANAIRQTWLPVSADHWHGTVAEGVTLEMRNGSKRHVPGTVMATVLGVKAKLEEVSAVKAELALVDTDQPNAYATVQAGRPIIALSLSYLDRFGADPDAVAATVGHELAHLRLSHSAAMREAHGAALDGTARDEERQADALGMRWATAAGYDPCGQARLFRAMSRDLPAGSTHPQFAERVAAANEASERTNGPCR